LFHRPPPAAVQSLESKPVVEDFSSFAAVAPALSAPAATESSEPAIHEQSRLGAAREEPATTEPQIPLEPKAQPAHDSGRTLRPKSSTPLAAQSSRGPLADNRLLELLEKDLDKAVEQPKERRRLEFSKQVVENRTVRHFVKFYTTTGRNHFQTLLARSGKYMPMIAKVLSQEGLPEELGYLALLESEFAVNTASPSGAAGLWQFVATTARQYGLRIDDWVDERRDPVKSTRAATAYLKDLHRRYGRWHLATAAYNAGPAIIDKALQSSRAKDFWSLKEKTQLSEETRNFVPKFVAIALIAADPAKYGIDPIRYETPLDYEEVALETPMKLETLAELADSSVSTIRDLNPALLRNSTPPGEHGYRVNLSVGKSALFLARAEERLQRRELESVQVVTHEVQKGETLFTIARRYSQEVRALMAFNGLKTSRLRIGQKLTIFLDGLRGTLK
jgi:membrane-bound lytic murein transglycosylase D